MYRYRHPRVTEKYLWVLFNMHHPPWHIPQQESPPAVPQRLKNQNEVPKALPRPPNSPEPRGSIHGKGMCWNEDDPRRSHPATNWTHTSTEPWQVGAVSGPYGRLKQYHAGGSNVVADRCTRNMCTDLLSPSQPLYSQLLCSHST